MQTLDFVLFMANSDQCVVLTLSFLMAELESMPNWFPLACQSKLLCCTKAPHMAIRLRCAF